ncbi:acrylyl-CoA reductase (NADPH) [Chromohalobacter canadensis]|uniref:MDR family oxidoreductase n=1 Tax=Chromohalobacter canadensis TaxID=141389 RepID=A0ABZ0Y7M5_9GAMM|nr:MDR family oxidoreductase [Chromohalobacter canadensis]MCK0769745.1 oxidoreductase [Chromohalobacter canadensis]WQH08054.1 MDR family oxidoreductase [Chromohalobacter canadensis]
MTSFKAILVSKDDERYQARMTSLSPEQLPKEPIEVAVEYSTLNYKDALAITGESPIIRHFPLVPGIDLAGLVTKSEDPKFKVGDAVMLNGWGVGESKWGGMSQRAAVRGEWLLPLPESFSTKEAMAIGTAGYTAALCVLALKQHNIMPADGDVLVTGASGGVGSIAVNLLSNLGYRVVASTGKSSEVDWLKRQGAADVIDRTELSSSNRPLAAERWSGVVDTVGSHTLASACASTQYGGVVMACGLAQGMDFPATVAPFILRGITLVGIDSVYCSKERRFQAWDLLAKYLERAALQGLITIIGLDEVSERAPDMLAGRLKGRVVVDVNV